MEKISVFKHVTADGLFAGPDGKIDWFQAVHDEWIRYAQEHADLCRDRFVW